MNERTRRAAWATALAAAVGAGCQSPFSTSSDDLGRRVAPERVRAVERLPLDEYARRDAASETDKPVEQQRPPNPFEGLERVEVTLEQARSWTLTNNMDLEVALVDPTIAAERLNEEEARFESIFFTDVRATSTDQPTSTTLEGSQVDIVDVEPGVRIPLRTGGFVTVSLPLNKTDTNNEFSTLNPSYESDLRLSISQPLLRGAGRRANTHSIRIAAIDEDIALSRTKLEVIRQVAAADRAYWRLYATRLALEVRQQQYELAMTQLEQARRLVAAGRDAEIEVTRAEEGVASRLEAIIIAQNDVFNRQRDLKRIINVPGLEMRSPILLETATKPDPVRFDLDPKALADFAVANRMEMLELELRLAADESTIDFQKNQALPLFTLDYSYSINGLGDSFNNSLNVMRDATFADWSLGLRAEVPIGNQAANSRVQQAILARLQRLSTKEARRLAIEQETLDAVDQLDATWQRILAARQSAVLAERTFRGEQRQFEIGVRTSTDVLDAATRLADAQLSEILALAQYEIARVDLAFATGTLLGAAKVGWEPSDPRESDEPRLQREYFDQVMGN